MHRITIDDALRAQLDGWSVAVEICDASGRTLGQFVPASPVRDSDNCPYDAEELARMQHEEGGRTLPEIWKSLGRT